LAAEIVALDAVQAAVTDRDFPQAVRLVDDYRREFPRGQLAPDADALAIEALAALGNRAELELRAARFLSRYPKDPHRARVAALAEPEPL
jgi:outer membrane protein assembly factor BamD (BamD/ComL family)